MRAERFRFGDWVVDLSDNSLAQGASRHQIEPLAMDVLAALCHRAGLVVSAEELLQQCWGSTLHGDNPVHKIITQLRRVLGDSAAAPRYIETIRKRGYRTVAPVARDDLDVPPPSSLRWRGQSPFRGLEPFDESHASVFFGRGEVTLRLRKAVAAQVAAGFALQLILGPSGSGKTSLVRAGLLPQLMQADATAGGPVLRCAVVFDFGDLASADLFSALGSVLLDWHIDGVVLFAGESAAMLGQCLASDPAAVARRLRDAVERGCGASGIALALFVDRLEALFARSDIDAGQRSAFLGALDQLARSACVLVLIACRNDFYAHIADYPLLTANKSSGGHFDLLPPSPAEIAQIIRYPARAAQLTFGRDPQSYETLDAVLCDSAAGNRDALPLLQYTLQELYRARTPAGELSFSAFHRLGGLEGAIRQRAEEVVAAFNEAQLASLPYIFSLVVRVAEADDTLLSRRASWQALRNTAERDAVTALVESRLFVSELEAGQASFGIAHEAILRRWERIAQWIEAHRSALKVRERVALLARRWAADGRPGDLLLPAGKQLDEARELCQVAAFSLHEEEQALIAMSAARARWRERARLGAIATVLLMALLSIGLGFSASSARHVAELRQTQAEGLMGFMLGDFAEKLRPLGRLDLLDGISGKALEYLSDTAAAQLSPASQTQRAQALQVIAEVQVARARPEAALSALHTAQAVLSGQLASHPDDAGVVKRLGVNAYWQGQIYLNQGRWDKAQQFFLQYQQHSNRLYALNPASADAWIEQSYAHTNLGLLALKSGKPDVAAPEFTASIALKRRAAQARPQDTSLAAELANSLSWLASSEEVRGRLNEAMRGYGQELEIVTVLHAAAPDHALWTSRMASALQRQSKICQAQGQDELALGNLLEAERLLQSVLHHEPANRVWQGSLAIVQLDRLRAAAPRIVPGEVLAQLTELAAKAAVLQQLDAKKAEWSRLQALTAQSTATVLLRLGQGTAAQATIERALRQFDALHRANSADVRSRSDLARTLLIAAAIAGQAGNAERVGAACGQADKLMSGLAAQSRDYRVLDPWVRAQFCLGREALSAPAVRTLRAMGYRETSFVHYLAHHTGASHVTRSE